MIGNVMTSFKSFEDLEVWKRSCAFSVEIYELTRNWKDWGLKDQMQRAAVSIASNIAEGHERRGKDFMRFLRIARGSAAEVRTQIYIARKIGLVPDQQFIKLIDESKQISRMLTGLSKSIENRPS